MHDRWKINCNSKLFEKVLGFGWGHQKAATLRYKNLIGLYRCICYCYSLLIIFTKDQLMIEAWSLLYLRDGLEPCVMMVYTMVEPMAYSDVAVLCISTREDVLTASCGAHLQEVLCPRRTETGHLIALCCSESRTHVLSDNRSSWYGPAREDSNLCVAHWSDVHRVGAVKLLGNESSCNKNATQCYSLPVLK